DTETLRDVRQSPVLPRPEQQFHGAEDTGGEDDLAGAQTLPVGEFHFVPAGVEGGDGHHAAVGSDLGSATLREPQIVEVEGVLAAVRTSDEASAAHHAPGALRSFATEEGIGDGDALLAEMDRHRRRTVGLAGAGPPR